MSSPGSPRQSRPTSAGPTIQDLESELEELKSDVDFLKLENSVFAKYYEKKKAETITIDDDEKKKGSRSKKIYPSTLTSEQKYEIASSVNEVIFK